MLAGSKKRWLGWIPDETRTHIPQPTIPQGIVRTDGSWRSFWPVRVGQTGDVAADLAWSQWTRGMTLSLPLSRLTTTHVYHASPGSVAVCAAGHHSKLLGVVHEPVCLCDFRGLGATVTRAYDAGWLHRPASVLAILKQALGETLPNLARGEHGCSVVSQMSQPSIIPRGQQRPPQCVLGWKLPTDLRRPELGQSHDENDWQRGSDRTHGELRRVLNTETRSVDFRPRGSTAMFPESSWS